MKGQTARTGLVFGLPERARFPAVLFACLLLSFCAHVAAFFLFQVVYPQRVTIPPPAPQLALLTGSTAENQAMLRWIEAEDPALVAKARSVAPQHLASPEYRPSYAVMKSVPIGSTEEPVPVPYPPVRSFLQIVRSARQIPPSPPEAAPQFASSLAFSASLSQRPLQATPTFHWPHPATDPLLPCTILAGVDATGAVRFTFLRKSSGNDTVDLDAMRELALLKFAASDEAVTWGMITINFGAEAYLSSPAENGGAGTP